MKSFKALGLFIILIIGTLLFAQSCGFLDDGIKTAHKEFDPSALLKKYEYFKNAAAELNAKKASIEIMQADLDNFKKEYEGTKRKDWDRTDKEDYNIKQTTVAGIKLSYNNLAAEYNAQMAKFNWRFCNAGSLPEGATDPLPREFASYLTQ